MLYNAFMFDLVKLFISAGDGGNGRVSFRREKFVPKGGPDGGKAGNGGSVIFRASRSINTLQQFAGVQEIKARAGQNGGPERMFGRNGEDTIVEVPVGTTLWILAENQTSERRRKFPVREGASQPEVHFEEYAVDNPRVSAIPPREADPVEPVTWEQLQEEGIPVEEDVVGSDLNEEVLVRGEALKNVQLRELAKIKYFEFTEEGQECVVCQGGVGGHGNEIFKSSKNTTPLNAQYGTYGEQKVLLLELKLLADVGLIGLPNAGKSTLLSIVTKANPKIGNYPFTTLEPQLGVLSLQSEGSQRDVVIADIPGLIEGASQGKGLGYDFLRHAQGCKVLLYLLSLDETEIYDETVTDTERGEQLWDQYEVLKKELFTHDPSFAKKPAILAVSKSDLYLDDQQAAIRDVFKKHGVADVLFFSAVTQAGIPEFYRRLQDVLE